MAALSIVVVLDPGEGLFPQCGQVYLNHAGHSFNQFIELAHNLCSTHPA